ncbi:MAG: hypothetical protein M1411_01200 [Candidatus Thermoplasmatota archaeon]|jgi:hypothetical protein|nr:hypothetical protein [Candidatus Thermoplasmatota archaeon]
MNPMIQKNHLLRICDSKGSYELVLNHRVSLKKLIDIFKKEGIEVIDGRILLIVKKSGIEFIIYESGRVIIKTREESKATAISNYLIDATDLII